MSQKSPSPTQDQGKRVSAKLVVAIVLAVLALIFIFSNLHAVTLHFLGFAFTMPMWIWFLILLVAGVVIGSLFPWMRSRKRTERR